MALAFGDIINASAKVIDTAVDEVSRQKETDKQIVKALRQDYERKPEVMGWISDTLKSVPVPVLQPDNQADIVGTTTLNSTMLFDSLSSRLPK